MYKEDELSELISKIFSKQTDNIIELLKLAGLNPKTDLRGMDLSQTDFSGQDLSHYRFDEVDFSSANLEGANLEGAILTRANLNNAILRNTNLSKANLIDSDLIGAILEGAYVNDIEINSELRDTLLVEGARFSEKNPYTPLINKNSATKNASLLLVDDHELVLSGVKHICCQMGYNVAGTASTGEESIDKVDELNPDVVFMDINMPGMGGLEATRRLIAKKPNLIVIVLTVHSDQMFVQKLLDAGARGYISKGSPADELRDGISRTQNNEIYLSEDIRRSFSNSKHSSNIPKMLSQRETQIMMLIVTGKKTSEISDMLSLSPKTISTYRYRLYEKLSVENDIEMANYAINQGYIA